MDVGEAWRGQSSSSVVCSSLEVHRLVVTEVCIVHQVECGTIHSLRNITLIVSSMVVVVVKQITMWD
jgi:hypothetical protein